MDLTNKSVDEIISIWRTEWIINNSGTQTSFCTCYNLNSGNFSRFISGKRGGKGYLDAILSYLTYNLNYTHSSFNQKSLGMIEGIFKLRSLMKSSHLNSTNSCQMIFFCDADNSAIRSNELEIISNMYNIIWVHVHTKNAPQSAFLSLLHYDWFIRIESETQLKDAADCVMVSMVSSIMFDCTIPIILISNDVIFGELLLQLHKINKNHGLYKMITATDTLSVFTDTHMKNIS